MAQTNARPKTSVRRRGLAVALGLLGVLTGSGCDLDSKIVTMRIDHYRDPCWESGPEFCIRVLETSDPTVAMPRSISGFDHDWGYVYEVAVVVRELGLTASASAADYELLDVLSRESVAPDAIFTLPLTGDFVSRVDATRFVMVGGLTAQCEDPSLCRTVADALHSAGAFEVELSHPTGPDRPFVAHAVTMRQ